MVANWEKICSLNASNTITGELKEVWEATPSYKVSVTYYPVQQYGAFINANNVTSLGSITVPFDYSSISMAYVSVIAGYTGSWTPDWRVTLTRMRSDGSTATSTIDINSGTATQYYYYSVDITGDGSSGWLGLGALNVGDLILVNMIENSSNKNFYHVGTGIKYFSS